MDGKHYLLPNEPDTTELNCLLVFYPDRDEYFRALVGSLAHLATWVAWERDEAHGATIAARLWKNALDLTLDNMGCFEQISAILASMDNSLSIIAANMGNGATADFSPIVNALGGIETAVSNLTFDSIISEDEMITINNCCSCGCSGSTGNPDTNLPPELPPDYNPPIPIPVPDEPNPEIDYMTIHKCAFAHYMFVKWRNVIIDTCSGGITLSNVIEKFQQAMADSPSVIGWAINNWGELVTYVGLYLAGVVGYASQCATEIDSKADAIKCAILAETSPDTKKQQVGVLIDIMGLPLFVRSYMKQVFNLLPLYLLYGGYIEGGTAVPAWAYAAGCPGCADPVPDPIASSLYLRDWSGTLGQCYVSTNGVDFNGAGSTGIAFDFNRFYYIKGDTAGHVDCEISATQGASVPVDVNVDVTNTSLITITLGTRLGGVAGTQAIAPGETVNINTSLLDYQPGVPNTIIKIWVYGLASE